MPCWAVIELLEGLQSLDEIEEALKEAKWDYTRHSDRIETVNPFTNGRLTFRREAGGVSSDQASPEEEAMLRSYKTARKIKAQMKKKGATIKKTTRVEGGIKIKIGV